MEEYQQPVIVERLDHCPVTPECVAKVLFLSEDGEVYRFSNHGNLFTKHICTTRNASQKPTIAYLGEWLNQRTGRTRWTGPFRMRRSAESPPYDKAFRRRSGGHEDAWKLKEVYVAKTEWEVAPPKPPTPPKSPKKPKGELTSQYIGVSMYRTGRWAARFGKQHIGYYAHEEEAALAWDEAARAAGVKEEDLNFPNPSE
jgi:hypothetical protein